MRIVLILLSLQMSLSGICQIPNGGFDNWSNLSSPNLEVWDQIGNVYRSIDAVSGNHSVRLENNGNLGTFGAIANVDLEDNLKGGQAYDEIPLVMSFWCKYDIASGDVAKVYAIFKAQGQALGTVDFTISGNSADTFVNFKFPIQWATQITPDTVIVVAASTDLVNPSVNGDGYLILDHVEFKTFSTLHDSVENHDFEDWTELDIPYPTDWFTSDVYLKQEFNFPFYLESVTKANDIQSGTGSLKLKNVEFDGKPFPGMALSGSSLKALTGPTFLTTRRWKYIHGLYMYDPDSTDVASVLAAFYKNGTLIGLAQQDFDSVRLGSYQYFSQAIQYFSADVPDSASIVITSANPEEPLGESSTLWIDNLSFSDHTAQIDDFAVSKLKFYPNPTSGLLHVEHHGNTQLEYEITDLFGHSLIRTRDSEIDLGSLPNSVYLLHIWEGNYRSTFKIMKL